jgi:uncharacterized FAD-dependent dehydrogenase
MKIRIDNIKIKVQEDSDIFLRETLLKKYPLREEDITDIKIIKKSLDARKKPQLFFVYTVDVGLKQQGSLAFHKK